MVRIRYIALCLFLMLSFRAAFAADNADRLILNYVNGESVEILLSEMPVITFEGDELKLSTTSTTLKCPLADLQDYTFDGASMSLDDRLIPNFSFKQDGDLLTVKSADGKPNIKLYDIQGIEMSPAVRIADDACLISIEDFVPGVYVILIDNHSFKIVKK